MTKTVWLVELFDAQFPEDNAPYEIKVALTKERAHAYALDIADECVEQLLDEEYVDDEFEPKVEEHAEKVEVLDSNGEVRWIVSWYEVEVV